MALPATLTIKQKTKCYSHERAINNSTKTEKKNRKKYTHLLSTHPNPKINEPPPQPSHRPIT